MSSTYLKLFRWAAVVVILAFLGRVLLRHWGSLADANLTWEPALLGAILPMLIVLQNLSMVGWMLVMRAMGLALPWRRGFEVFHQSQVVRLLPGNFWHVVGRTYMTTADGLSSPLVFCSMVFENALILVAAMLVFTMSLPFWGDKGPGESLYYVAAAPVLLALVYPPLLSRLLNFGLKLIRKSPVTVEIKYRHVLAIAGYQTFVRLFGGTCLFLIVLSVYPLPLSRMPAIIGMHSIAYVVGVLSFIAPGGLGVREATLSYLLSQFMPIPVAVVIALLARFLWTFIEMANAGAAVLVGRVYSSRTRDNNGARLRVQPLEVPASEP